MTIKIVFKKNKKKHYRVDFDICLNCFFENNFTLSAISYLPANDNAWMLPCSDLRIVKQVSSNLLVKFDSTKAFVNDKATIYLIIAAYIELAKKHQLTVEKVIYDDADILDKSILLDLLDQKAA
ncbi:hypothetical protein [Acinetobacter sp. SEK570]|uniref:hypothetical protein n=1 Tax=unclassified Acinetobacter TaxID=196816 RepID=UPI0039A21F47